MTDESTPEDVAKKRILALHQMAQINCKNTGGDPAEAVFELLTAACLLAGHNLKDRHEASDLLAEILPAAARCAEGWFAPLSRRNRSSETLQ